jgi:hypothetical protein
METILISHCLPAHDPRLREDKLCRKTGSHPRLRGDMLFLIVL